MQQRSSKMLVKSAFGDSRVYAGSFHAIGRNYFFASLETALMLYVATVYHIATPENDEPNWKGDFQIELEMIGSVLVPAETFDQPDGLGDIAAEAWAKTVGIPRREFLRELGAPSQIIDRCTVVDREANTLETFEPAPSCFDCVGGASRWIYYNLFESWLISVDEG